MQVAIGIHVCSLPEQLEATLGMLRRNTAVPAEIILLPDGPDAPVRDLCGSLTGIRQLSTSSPLGAPACFNRLAAATAAPVIVFLESGALVGPGWLERLVDALTAHPQYGLAGPSTNRSWNEQCAFPDAGSAEPDIERTAALASDRFGRAVRTLEPLHSLADFCYAVRREVVDAIGLADEGYGRGPCWEMDYNVRADRAGFRGLWVMGAYVHRLPCIPRRRHEEAVLFARSKRLYQDKFCALRLGGMRTDYEQHCAGDACEHFAPTALIRIREEHPSPAPARTADEALPSGPLVTCITPTRGRCAWLLQSIRYFQRQDYSPRELVIVDDGDDDLSGRLPGDDRVRYVRVPRMTLGAKRNLACALGRGEYIASWDDDDWFGDRRLTAQLEPLLGGVADITGLRTDVFFDLPAWRFWRCTPALHRRMFVGDVAGGTLVFRREVWEQLSRYSDVSCGEDADFLRGALAAGARLRPVPGFDHFVYLRHDSNTWAFGCGLAWDAGDWQTVRVPPHLVPDIDFYLSISSRTTMPSPSLRVVHGRAPLVSCVMPTADRRRFVRQAIRGFLRQDYPNRELIIVDDGREKVGDLLPSDPRIRYVPLIGRVPLGLKRNLACEYARGSIIAHWDDDDWTADWRLSYQVESLLDGDGDLCGLTSLVFFDPRARQAWRYSYASSSPPWLAGATLCYTKAHWQATRFEEVDAGEDARFLAASAHARIVPLDDDRCYAALVHPGNTHVKRTSDVRYRPYPFEELAARLGGDLQEYAEDTAAQRGAAALPFISCIMPTRDRRVFVPQAIRCFLRQEHARRELIIVDDGVDRVGDLVPSDDRVRYLSLPAPLSLGEKRNIAVRESRGSIVAHWDDDDWYHPTYLSRVSARLESPPYPRAVNGLGTFLVWVVGDEDVRVCRSGGVAGGTIAYARDLWESRAYRDVTCGEDTFFLEDTRAVVQADHEAQSLYVLVRHGRNTWRSQNGSDVTAGMRRLPLHGRGIEEITGEDAGFYVRAEQALRQAAGLG